MVNVRDQDTATALIDSGADISAVNANYVERKQVTIFKKDSAFDLRSANRSPIPTRGSCVLEISVNKCVSFVPYEFVVIDGLAADLIVGDDFLRTYGAVLDLEKNTFTLSRHEYDAKFDPNVHETLRRGNLGAMHVAKEVEKEVRLVAARTVSLEPRTISVVKVRANSEKKIPGLVIAQPTEALLLKKNALFAASLITIESGQSSLLLENHTDERITIPQNMHIASAQEVATKDSNPILAALSPDAKSNRKHTCTSDVLADVEAQINAELSRRERESIKNILTQFLTLFPRGDEPPRQTHLVKHTINTGQHVPIRAKYTRRYAPIEREIIALEVQKMLEQGIIQESSSPWNSPIVLVKKKDGSVRFCIDFRQLNKVTKRDTYPIPLIEDCLDCLSGARSFSSLDLKSGYFQCPLAEEDREKTAFVTPDGGLFEFKCLPFGLSNGPSTFERLMDSILRGRKWKHCLVYLDDLCVFGASLEQHNERLRDILECLDRANLSLNVKKCSFGSTKLNMLGYEITREGVRPDSSETSAIRDFPTPTNQKAVRSFLGLCSYYRKFIENFSKIAAPLNALLRVGVNFVWSVQHQSTFEALKSKLINPPLLGHFNMQLPITLRTDACKYGIGAIAAQTDSSGREHVIAYASRTLSETESEYSTTDQEGLAVIWAMKKFRPYVYGRPVTVVTDHHALCWLMTAKGLTGRLARWALQLQEFELQVVYKQGRKHLDADCLSRYPEDWVDGNGRLAERDKSQDHQEEKASESPQTTLAALSLQGLAEKQKNDPTLEEIRKKAENSPSFETVSDVLYKRNFSRVGENHLLVRPESLRREALTAAHTNADGGHLRLAKTYGKLVQKFYWPRLFADADRLVKSCRECQQRKRDPNKLGLLHHMETPSKIFHTVGIDLLSFNATESGNKVIATAICHLSKFLITRALPDGSAENVARFLIEDIILRFGAPKVLISDQGKVFMSELIDTVNRIFDIQPRRTSPYHPQTNGLTERSHLTIAYMLSKFINSRSSDWDLYLPFVTHAYNTAPQKSTKFSPFFLVHGTEASTTFDADLPSPPETSSFSVMEYAERLRLQLEEARQLARSLADKEKEANKIRYDEKRREKAWKINDVVWVSFPRRKVAQSDKLQKRYFGPFRITAQTGAVTFQVTPEPNADLPGPRTGQQVVHTMRLKPFEPSGVLTDPEGNTIPPDEEEPPPTGPEHTGRSNQLAPPGEMSDAPREQTEINQPVTQEQAERTDRRLSNRSRRPPAWTSDFVEL